MHTVHLESKNNLMTVGSFFKHVHFQLLYYLVSPMYLMFCSDIFQISNFSLPYHQSKKYISKIISFFFIYYAFSKFCSICIQIQELLSLFKRKKFTIIYNYVNVLVFMRIMFQHLHSHLLSVSLNHVLFVKGHTCWQSGHIPGSVLSLT